MSIVETPYQGHDPLVRDAAAGDASRVGWFRYSKAFRSTDPATWAALVAQLRILTVFDDEAADDLKIRAVAPWFAPLADGDPIPTYDVLLDGPGRFRAVRAAN